MGKVLATPTALDLLTDIQKDHGEVMFHLSGGCCDGSAPICLALGDLILNDQDLLLGEIGCAPFYIRKAQYDAWNNAVLTVDATKGKSSLFSLDSGRDKRFVLRPRPGPANKGLRGGK